jgi:hypothetical protein
MSIPSKTIGSLPVGRVHSVSYTKGKWTCTIARDGFQNQFNEDKVSLPSVGQYRWVSVRSEMEDLGEGVSTRYDIYESGSDFVTGGPASAEWGVAATETWGMSVSLNLMPLSMHKKISYLKNTYKGRLQDGEWIWPEYDPTGRSSRSGTDRAGNFIVGINPMYGVQEFLSPTCSLTKTKVLPGDYMELGGGLGQIQDPPESAPVSLPRGRAGSGPSEHQYWLKSADAVSIHGNDHEITEAWDFSPHGWNSFIYS